MLSLTMLYPSKQGFGGKANITHSSLHAGVSSTDHQALESDTPTVLAQVCAQTLSGQHRQQQRELQALCSSSGHGMGWQPHLPHLLPCLNTLVSNALSKIQC